MSDYIPGIRIRGRELNGPEDFLGFLQNAGTVSRDPSIIEHYARARGFINDAIASGENRITQGLVLPYQDVILRHGDNVYSSAGKNSRVVHDVGFGDFGAYMIQEDGYRIGGPELSEAHMPSRPLTRGMFYTSAAQREPYETQQVPHAIFNMHNYGVPYEDVNSIFKDIRSRGEHMPWDYKSILGKVADFYDADLQFTQDQTFAKVLKDNPGLTRNPSLIYGDAFNKSSNWFVGDSLNAMVGGQQIVPSREYLMGPRSKIKAVMELRNY